MSVPDRESIKRGIVAALNRRAQDGRHLHSSACIHNLPPEEQIEVRGKTVEWWTTCVGPLPEQITPDQWEAEPLDLGEATP